eukprot:752825-Hanusia_phi.AAC.1
MQRRLKQLVRSDIKRSSHSLPSRAPILLPLFLLPSLTPPPGLAAAAAVQVSARRQRKATPARDRVRLTTRHGRKDAKQRRMRTGDVCDTGGLGRSTLNMVESELEISVMKQTPRESAINNNEGELTSSFLLDPRLGPRDGSCSR